MFEFITSIEMFLKSHLVLLSILGVIILPSIFRLWNARLQKRNIELEGYKIFFPHREKIYKNLTSIYRSIINDDKNNKNRDVNDIAKRYVAQIQGLIDGLTHYGNIPTIEKWHKINKISNDMTMDAVEKSNKTLQAVEELLIEIRKSMGHDDSKYYMRPGSILALLIKEEEKPKIYEACENRRWMLLYFRIRGKINK